MSSKEIYTEDAHGIHIQIEHDNDPVNHPSHYTDGKIEVKEFIRDKKLNFFLGNVVKYVCRAGKKFKDKELEDLKKARWYLEDEICEQIKAEKNYDEKHSLKHYFDIREDEDSGLEEIILTWRENDSNIYEIRGTIKSIKQIIPREMLETKEYFTINSIPDLFNPGENIIRVDIRDK